MPSHSWLLLITVATCATFIHATTKHPFTDDPLYSKILSTTTEESKQIVSNKKWPPTNQRIPLANDPR